MSSDYLLSFNIYTALHKYSIQHVTILNLNVFYRGCYVNEQHKIAPNFNAGGYYLVFKMIYNKI